MPLVIRRKVNEKISLSNGVIITITALEGGTVGVGIDAPKHVGIQRSDRCYGCGCATFDYYLGYRNLPFCGSPDCECKIKNRPIVRLENG